MWYGFALALAVGLGLPLAVAFASQAQARAAAAALESIARQPEAAGRVQTAMIIALALIESLVIYVLLAFFLLNGKLVTVTEAAQAMPAAAPAAAAPAAVAPGYAQ
jgi:F-type H+-transporting ATPase subunit c